MVADVVAKIRRRRDFIEQAHATYPETDRHGLAMDLTVGEALELVDALEVGRRALTGNGYALVGQFLVRSGRPGKTLLHLVGDGEGGEFSESELSAVIAQFYRERF